MNDQNTTLQTAQVITLGNSVSTFIETALLGDSAANVRWYTARLRLFVKALGEERELGSITERDLVRWYRALQDRTETEPPTLAVDTLHGYTRAVRRLFKWLYERRLTVTELWPVLKLPTLPELERKGVNDSNVEKIIEAARLASLRDYAILLLIRDSGARRGGVASLKLSDLSLDEPEPNCRRITVHEKGQRTRKVFITPEALNALNAWLAVRSSPTPYVFVDERPKKKGARLKPGGVSQMITRYKQKLGLVGPCSPHQWRHRFARVRIIDGMPLNVVSQMLGHKSVVVTAKHYGNLMVNELQTAYDDHQKKHAKPG